MTVPRPETLAIRAEVAAEAEEWLTAWRDGCALNSVGRLAVDVMLDDMRLHHQTGTPLNRHVCQSAGCAECAGETDPGPSFWVGDEGTWGCEVCPAGGTYRSEAHAWAQAHDHEVEAHPERMDRR